MLTRVNQTDIIKRFAPAADLKVESRKDKSGSISVFPNTPLDMPTETFSNALNRREQNRKQLLRWIRENFKEGVHFGRQHIDERCQYARTGNPSLCRDIRHYSRPFLYKAGSELIINVLGLSAHFPNLHQYELSAVHHQEIQEVVLKCELRTSNGTVVAEGAGARHVHQDHRNLNKSIKMAVKSALADSVIRIAGLSGTFIKTHHRTLTQVGVCYRDEFLAGGERHKRFTRGSDCHHSNEAPITKKQTQLIQYLAGRKGYTTDSLTARCKSRFGKDLNALNKVEASRFINKLINSNG